MPEPSIKTLLHWIIWKLWDERFFIFMLVLAILLVQKLLKPF